MMEKGGQKNFVALFAKGSLGCDVPCKKKVAGYSPATHFLIVTRPFPGLRLIALFILPPLVLPPAAIFLYGKTIAKPLTEARGL